MTQKKIRLVRDYTSGGVVVKASVEGRRVTLKGKFGNYSSDDSAKRAWRKYAAKHNITNYTYVSV